MFKNRSTFGQNLTVSSAWRNFYLNLIAGAFYEDHEARSCYCGNYLCKIKTERASEWDKETGCGRWEWRPSGDPDPGGKWPVTQITHYDMSGHTSWSQLSWSPGPSHNVTNKGFKNARHLLCPLPLSLFSALSSIPKFQTQINRNSINFVSGLSVLV